MKVPESVLSPWQMILGERFAELHPRLRTYFELIPVGSVGIGNGVFTTVGTPLRWVRVLIRLVADPDVLFSVWARDVPFSVTNRPSGTADRPAVVAERTFRFSSGDRVMRDRITATPDGIVDILGAHRRIRALFVAEVVEGALHLTSSRVALRIGKRHFHFPQLFAPKVTLTERFSEDDNQQHVSLAMNAPLVGRVYEYSGSFRYDIRLDAA